MPFLCLTSHLTQQGQKQTRHIFYTMQTCVVESSYNFYKLQSEEGTLQTRLHIL